MALQMKDRFSLHITQQIEFNLIERRLAIEKGRHIVEPGTNVMFCLFVPEFPIDLNVIFSGLHFMF
jgi:hypothetical protein